MQRITFSGDPADLTLRAAAGLAVRYWAATVRLWLLPVVAVGVTAAGVTWALGADPLANGDGTTLPGGTTLAEAFAPRFTASGLILAVTSTVACWAYLAIGLAGIGRIRLTPGWLLARGVRVIPAELAFVAGTGLVDLGLVVIGRSGGDGAMALAMIVTYPVLFWLLLRLGFWSVAIIDGRGVLDGLRASWAISRGAVLRILRWVFALSVPTVALTLAADAAVPPGSGGPLLAGVKGGLLQAVVCLGSIVSVLLYESQRRRWEARASSPGDRAPWWAGPLPGPPVAGE